MLAEMAHPHPPISASSGLPLQWLTEGMDVVLEEVGPSDLQNALIFDDVNDAISMVCIDMEGDGELKSDMTVYSELTPSGDKTLMGVGAAPMVSWYVLEPCSPRSSEALLIA
jgi:hypothetical protein